MWYWVLCNCVVSDANKWIRMCLCGSLLEQKKKKNMIAVCMFDIKCG